MMKYLKIYYRLLIYLTCFTGFSGNIKKKLCKKALKMTSQLVIFKAFFFAPLPPTLNLKKKIPVNQLIKKSGLGHLYRFTTIHDSCCMLAHLNSNEIWYPIVQTRTIAICSLLCLYTLIALIANNINPDQTAPLGAV